MSLAIAITSNWQLHIPQTMRGVAGLNAPGVVMATASPGVIIIRPQKSRIMSLAGSLHSNYLKKPININRFRDSVDYTAA